jgi:hypothetical protein
MTTELVREWWYDHHGTAYAMTFRVPANFTSAALRAKSLRCRAGVHAGAFQVRPLRPWPQESDA